MCEHEDSLRDEVRQHFREEAQKRRRAARKTPNLPVVYYEEDWDYVIRPTECDELWDDSQVNKK